MSRARELAKVGGKNQQVVAGLSSHVGVSTFASDVYMYSNLEVTGTTTFNGGTLTLGDANTDNIVFGGEVDSHIIPDDDGTYNLGSATKEWNNIFIDGTANIDALLADTAKIGDLTDNRVVIAGTSGELEDSGNLTFDGSILTTTNVVVTGDTDLGNATSDTITATGRFDSDIVPSTDNARDLGASGLEFKDLYLDGTANIDSLVADTADINGGTVDGAAINSTTIGASSPSTGAFTTLSANGNVDLGDATSDTITATGRFDSDLTPSTDGARDLGASGLEWQDLFIDGTAKIDTLTVDENATVAGTLDVNSSLLTVGVGLTDVIVRGGMRVTGIMSVGNGTVTIDETTVKTGTSNLHNVGIEIAGINVLGADTPIGENATIFNNGNATFAGEVTAATLDISGNIDIDGTTNLDAVDIDGAVDMASNLTLAGNADFNGNLDVDGTTDLDTTNVVGTLTVTGDIAADNVTINGNTVSTSTGNLTIDSTGGTVTLSDNISISGNGSVTGTFDVDGATTLDGLTVAEGAAFSSTLDVDGATTLDGLTVAEGASFSSTLDVDGATTLDGLTVAEAATFDVGVTITGALDANGGASIDNIQIGVTGDNEIDTASGNLTIDSAGGTVTVDDNLTVSGNLTVNGTTTTINSTTVAIDDKNFQVATGAADDAAADGAGLTVDSGDGDKTFNFEATGDNWGASENLNLASGKAYKINNASILNATTLGSSVVASSLTSVGTIATGVWNGTAITNANLANSSVSYGGISLSLGGTDATPAFDLSDATNYPTSSLSGTITNAQLAGSIANGKLANSTVSYGGVTLSLGGSDGTPAFDLSDATNYPTSSLSGTITNAQLAGSIAGTKLENSGVTAAAYGSSSAIPIITVDAQGLVTSATTTAIDSTTISQLNTSVACTDTGSNGLITVTADGSTVAVFDQALITVTGNILPEANGTRDLGASGTRWANVYSSDLDLSNQAKGGNSVDGTWGSYLVEEGEDHLFLTNRRNGKKYRFMVEEV